MGPQMHVGPSFQMAIKHLLSFMLVSCLAYSLSLMMEVTNSFEVYAEYQRTTWHYIPKARALNFRSKRNLLKRCIPYALHDQYHYLIA
jgi:uncharacterized membrane protein YesL